MPRVLDALIYEHPFFDRALVLVEAEVREVVSRFRQTSPAAREAGGILIGYRRRSHLHIVEATFPFERDRRSRFTFHREDSRHSQIASSRWAASNRRADYLGEWHTHPEERATPSNIDVTEWRLILARASGPMLFWIAGIRTDWIGVGRGEVLKEAHLAD